MKNNHRKNTMTGCISTEPCKVDVIRYRSKIKIYKDG